MRRMGWRLGFFGMMMGDLHFKLNKKGIYNLGVLGMIMGLFRSGPRKYVFSGVVL